MNGMMDDRKVPLSISFGSVAVDSASCYPTKITKDVVYYAGQNNEDKNSLRVKLIDTEKHGRQLELVLMGDYHEEKIAYSRTDAKAWKSWMRIDIPIAELDKLIEILTEMKKI
jgi:hypothetical protein